MFGNAKGREDPASAVLSCAWQRTEDNPATENLQVARGLAFQRLNEALHLRGPRCCGEVLAFALRRLDPADQLAMIDFADCIVAWPPAVIRYLGADRYAPPQLVLVP
jgi:hypothetical protein